MANYYTEFSQVIANLSEEEEAWLKSVLDIEECINDDDEYDYIIPDSAPSCQQYIKDTYAEDWPGFSYEFCDPDRWSAWGRHLWVYSEEGGIDALAYLMQDFIVKFRPDKVMYIRFAQTCSEPRVDAFGGGACRIDKDGAFWISDTMIDSLYERGRDA